MSPFLPDVGDDSVAVKNLEGGEAVLVVGHGTEQRIADALALTPPDGGGVAITPEPITDADRAACRLRFTVSVPIWIHPPEEQTP